MSTSPVSPFAQRVLALSRRPAWTVAVHALITTTLFILVCARLYSGLAPTLEEVRHPKPGLEPPTAMEVLDQAVVLLFDNSMTHTLGITSARIQAYLNMLDLYPGEEVFMLEARAPAGMDPVEELQAQQGLSSSLMLHGISRVHWAGTLPGAPIGLASSRSVDPRDLQDFAERLALDPLASTVTTRAERRGSWLYYPFLSEEIGNRDTWRQRLDTGLAAAAARVLTEQGQPVCEDRSQQGCWTVTVIGVPSTLGEMVLAIAFVAGVNLMIANLVIVLVLWWLFRHKRLVVLTVVAVLQGQALTLLPFLLTGHRMDWLSSSVLTAVMLLGVAGACHHGWAYLERRMDGASIDDAVEWAVSHVIGPHLLTVVTSVIALSALASSSVPSMATYGLFTAIGISLSFVTAVTLLPALLKRYDVPITTPPSDVVERTLVWTATWCFDHPVRTLAGSALVFAVGVAGTVKLVDEGLLDSNVAYYFGPESDVSLRQEDVQQRFPLVPYYVLLELPEQGTLRWNQREMLVRLSAFERDLLASSAFPEASPVREVVSLVDMAGSGCLAFEDWQCTDGLPARTEDVLDRQELPLLGLLTPDRDFAPDLHTRLMVLTDPVWTRGGPVIEAEVTRLAQRHFPEATVSIDGTIAVWWSMENVTQAELYSGLIWALSLIALFLGTVFALVRPSLLPLLILPNLPPIPIALGVFGWLGDPISTPTLVAVILSIGLIVDDSTFAIGHLSQHLRAGRSRRDALIGMVRDAGVPIAGTSLALSIGFGTLIVSLLRPIALMGVLLGLIIILALVADGVLISAGLGLAERFSPSEEDA